MTTRDPGRTPLGDLAGFAPELAETFVTVASDIALVVDLDGTIRSVAVGADSPTPTASSWVGRPWVDTVTSETRRKIVRLLDEVAVTGVSRRCEVDHLLPSGAGVPVAYSAVRLGRSGPVLAAGRDLRAIAAIQQRFVHTQQQMERDYWRRRDAETRYRRLFHVATDAVLVVDARTLAIVEGNPAAALRYALPASSLAGRAAGSVFDATSRLQLEQALASARDSGAPFEIRAWLAGRTSAVDVGATPFRSGDGDMLLLRMRTVEPDESEGSTVLSDFVERTPDAVAITDTGGRVQLSNPAFATLCGVPAGATADGRPIAEWLGAGDGEGRGGREGDVAALLAEVRRSGFVQRAATRVRPAVGPPVDVELSAAMLTDGDTECIGFTLRRVSGDDTDHWTRLARAETRALLGRVGEVPLADLLDEAVSIAERHFTRRALELADHDVAGAARMLGVEPDAVRRLIAADRSDAGPGP